MIIGASNQLSDSQLLAEIERGNTASFEILFRRHYDRVFGLLIRLVGNRQEAEDLAQEVFLKLYQQRWDARSDHNVGAWLYQVATRSGYNAIRSRKRQWTRDTLLVPDETNRPPNPADLVEEREATARVRRALAQLKPAQVQLLLLRQMGLSYAELSESCGIKATSVGKQLTRATDAFRHAFHRSK